MIVFYLNKKRMLKNKTPRCMLFNLKGFYCRLHGRNGLKQVSEES